MAKKAVNLKQLQAKWYKKLAKSGFEDIEQDEDNLKFWSSFFSLRNPKVVWEAKAEYYTMAESFLNEFPFDTQMEKNIWAYHSTGLSARDIAATLEKAKIRKMSYVTVWRILRKLENNMKKMYKIGYGHD